MIPATPPQVQMRLVRDDVDDDDAAGVGPDGGPASDSHSDVDRLRRERDDARAEAAGLRRRAAALDAHLARLDIELRLAGRLQRDFLPKRLPQVGPARFATLFRPAAHVSGDFYDVVRLDEGHVGFYVADAVGHGVPAALLTMFIKQTLATKQIVPGGGYRLLSPAETMARLNTALLDQGLSASTFATAVYGVVNVHTRQVTLARAGHPAPLLLAADGSVAPVECDGGLLGILPDEQFAESALTLAAGDRLLLYTDGVEVAFADRAAASLDRWRATVAAHAGGPADRLLSACADAVDAFNGDALPMDDLTLLALEMD